MAVILTPDYAIELPWLIFVTYWLIAGFRVNKMERREPAGSTLARILIMAPAYYLLFSHDLDLGLLNLRFVPYRDWIFLLGSALTWVGVGFAICARYHLAQFWSASVALRAGHQLIRTGPYAHIRHPIYTGMLTAVLGSALAVGRYRALLAFLAILAGFVWKSIREEKLLASQFGSTFDEHRRHSGFFLPRLS
jgi:protein-S-isoprenylcysteine O-methyltransferase Ste14